MGTAFRKEFIIIILKILEKGVATIVFMENYGKTRKNKDKASLRKPYPGPGVNYVWGRY